MAKLSTATTLLVNPPGAAPVLTQEQLWRGLVEKCLRPQTGFVGPIVGCEVTEHTDAVVDRIVSFADAKIMGAERVHERIELVQGHSAVFIQDSGNRVLNLVSRGAGADELYLTFDFQLNHDDAKDGPLEERVEQYAAMGVKTIESTLEKIRQLVRDGKDFGN